MSNEDGRKVATAFLSKLGAEGDVDGWLDLLDDNAVSETPTAPEGLETRFEGRAVIAARFGAARRPMRFFTFENEQILATEDPELWVATCTSRGQQADGRHYSNTYCWLIRVRGGKVVWWREYYDPQKVMPFLENISHKP